MAVRYIGFCLFVLWSLFIIKLKIFYLNDVNILIMDCVTSYILNIHIFLLLFNV